MGDEFVKNPEFIDAATANHKDEGTVATETTLVDGGAVDMTDEEEMMALAAAEQSPMRTTWHPRKGGRTRQD